MVTCPVCALRIAAAGVSKILKGDSMWNCKATADAHVNGHFERVEPAAKRLRGGSDSEPSPPDTSGFESCEV